MDPILVGAITVLLFFVVFTTCIGVSRCKMARRSSIPAPSSQERRIIFGAVCRSKHRVLDGQTISVHTSTCLHFDIVSRLSELSI